MDINWSVISSNTNKICYSNMYKHVQFIQFLPNSMVLNETQKRRLKFWLQDAKIRWPNGAAIVSNQIGTAKYCFSIYMHIALIFD